MYHVQIKNLLRYLVVVNILGVLVYLMLCLFQYVEHFRELQNIVLVQYQVVHTNLTTTKNARTKSAHYGEINTKDERERFNDDNLKPTKFILFWTTYFSSNATSIVNFKPYFDKCSSKCEITSNRSLLQQSAAVVFHSRDLVRTDLPNYRLPHQVWIYLQQESPTNTVTELSEYANLFNWTMSYRRDSDIFYPYASIVPSQKLNGSFSRSAQKSVNKTKLVAWVVSNCETQSRREDFVNELINYVPVDIYGKCGQLRCPKDKGRSKCFTDIELKYKFYLSLENSLCQDYVTEKFFHALNLSVVPVVYGLADYASFAPPHSYINARDFNSSKELAEYLLYLDKNHEKYLEYFVWKDSYEIAHSEGWCTLCRKLMDTKSIRPKVYSDLAFWWKYSPIENEHAITNQFPVSVCTPGKQSQSSYDFTAFLQHVWELFKQSFK